MITGSFGIGRGWGEGLCSGSGRHGMLVGVVLCDSAALDNVLNPAHIDRAALPWEGGLLATTFLTGEPHGERSERNGRGK